MSHLIAAVIERRGTAAVLAGAPIRAHIQESTLDRRRGVGHVVSAIRVAKATILASVTVPEVGALLAVAAGPYAGDWSVLGIASRDEAVTVLDLQQGQRAVHSNRRTEVTA